MTSKHDSFCAGYQLNGDGILKAAHIRDLYANLERQLIEVCPEGRELTLALTSLETSCFFAVKAVAKQRENQE